MRVFAEAPPERVGEQAELGQDPNWRYGAFATNTPAGQVQHLDARHRTDELVLTATCIGCDERLGRLTDDVHVRCDPSWTAGA